ncbi:MAG: EVE domain-containing protein [Bacteroidia bacterium]|nr:EVE domain-containing protein [Bacteroidia bacterium]NNC86232.1 EVE domain-containing protein [Bacteroidia bacterium]NNM15772.1 EVE domain-containing protein [Bacteroidia bacterium]
MAKEKKYWLVKTEPFKYSWDQLVEDDGTFWDGVRNYQARNNMRDMKKGDQVFVYHSNEGKEIVGIAKITKEAYQDPTTDNDAWVAVDLKPVKPLKNSVPLSTIKATKSLKDLLLVRNGRLSVMPVTEKDYNTIIDLSKQKEKATA